MNISIVLFHSNLRLHDNAALVAASETGGAVLPVFVLDENLGRSLGAASRWWLHHSLARLDESLREIGSGLIYLRGDALKCIEALIDETGASQIFLQHGYDGDVQSFEKDLNLWAVERDVQVHRFGGHVLFPPESISTKQGKPYTVFSPYWRECLNQRVPGAPLSAPTELRAPDNAPHSLVLEELALLPTGVDWTGGLADSFVPGEKSALEGLTEFMSESLLGYKSQRDRPDMAQATSRMSPHLRFGEISPRAIWTHVRHTMDANPALQTDGDHFLREIGWRDFSYHLLHHFPSLPRDPLRPAFAKFPWRDDDFSSLAAWQRGLTGFPIVDAGMRQLWQTGWMHNRVRMIVASFLVKELLIHWHEGEAWFWDTLVDADPASNTASWQWVAGCGADAAPYFRIFNPVLQGEKFDPEGAYVRTYLPELSDLPKKFVHHPWDAPADVLESAGLRLGETYPKPIVDRKLARARALEAFEQIKVRK
jgi:deoxyribodipyrimidine photo-lyase